MCWNHFRSIDRRWLWYGLAYAVMGCSGQSSVVYPVHGKLLADGQPVVRASIAFHSADDAQVRCPVGVTDADGSYRLTTFAANDGAPPGEYTVTVLWPDENMVIDECEQPSLVARDRCGGRYADPMTSPLRAIIRPGTNQVVLHVEEEPHWRRPPGAKSPTVRAILESAQRRESVTTPPAP